MENNYILIECKPGYIKPDKVLKSLIDDIDLIIESDFKIIINEFGQWIFKLCNKEDIYIQNYDTIVERLNHAYYSGLIRVIEYNCNYREYNCNFHKKK